LLWPKIFLTQYPQFLRISYNQFLVCGNKQKNNEILIWNYQKFHKTCLLNFKIFAEPKNWSTVPLKSLTQLVLQFLVMYCKLPVWTKPEVLLHENLFWFSLWESLSILQLCFIFSCINVVQLATISRFSC
jgi:hypothetical protein